MKEFELRKPVCEWLLSRGLIPVLECQSLSNCDIVGVEFSGAKLTRMVAVELKLHDVAGVIRQCTQHFPRVTEVYAAMPDDSALNARYRFEILRCGLLSVGEKVSILQEAETHADRDLSRWYRAMHRRRNEYLERMKDPMVRAGRLKMVSDADSDF